jgi:hypothetical protein
MYLHPYKFSLQQDRQLYRERIARNEKYRKLFPLIRRYAFISDRAEQSIRNDIEENSFQRLQVDYISIFFSFYRLGDFLHI